MTPQWETLSGKKTYGAVMAQSKEALRQPQKNRQCKRPLQEVTVNTDDGCTRSPASRPKNVRMQGRSPTVCENGLVQSRVADTARNDAANENQPETCEM